MNIELPKIETLNPTNIALFLKNNITQFNELDHNFEYVINNKGNKKIKIESNEKTLFVLSSFCLTKLYLNFIILKTIHHNQTNLITEKNLYLKETIFGFDNKKIKYFGIEPNFERINSQFRKLSENYKVSANLIDIKESIYDIVLFFKNNDLLLNRFFIYSSNHETHEPNFEEILQYTGIF